jgi:cyclic pyranopterin phosphate synthase
LRRLKQLPGVQSVTLTTNGVLLAPLAQELAFMGLDGVNISLDTCDAARFAAITGTDALADVLAGIDACVRSGLRTKLNCVLLEDSLPHLPTLAAFAQDAPLDVRFIEMMPLGCAAAGAPVRQQQALDVLRAHWPDLHSVNEQRGNGPAHYYASQALQGRIGFIDAVSHRFCARCNRVRVTSTGVLKPCLCYSEGVDLRRILRKAPEKLPQALRQAIYQKPQAHCFHAPQHITEQKTMNQIGG